MLWRMTTYLGKVHQEDVDGLKLGLYLAASADERIALLREGGYARFALLDGRELSLQACNHESVCPSFVLVRCWFR